MPVERASRAVRKVHEVGMCAVGRTLDDFAHRPTASDALALTVSLLNQSHHLGAGGEDEVRVLWLVGHVATIREGFALL